MNEARAEAEILWAPTEAQRDAATMTAFLTHVEGSAGRAFPDYETAWRWSVEEPEAFWAAIAEFFQVPFRTPPTRILADARMPGARWFEDATLNYAEAVFKRATGDRPALMAASERRTLRAVSWADLRRDVAAVAAGLRRLGVRRGDRVASIVPNIPEAVVALLATASLGAIWSSCAPEFGARSIVDRLRQIDPTVLIAVDGYAFGGRSFDRLDVVEQVRAALPGLTRTVLIRDLDAQARLDGDDWIDWATFLAEAADAPGDLAFEPVPFDHPLWILFSSGTTGLPKAIVHGHGGVVLEHAKAVGLHLDVRPGDRLLWYTTTGWMMWNFLVGSLLVGGTAVLYDGSPGHPDLDVLWGLAEVAKVTHLGASAAFLMACRNAELMPGRTHDLAHLRCIGSTGSPLPIDGFRWVYGAVGRDVRLDSLSGGTDVVSAFVGGAPVLPVRAGELSCRYLGARVEAFGEDGRPVPAGQTGELVITAPMPSMPVRFWNDEGGRRYRESYFERFPGVWRHGDWIRFTPSGGAVIEGRSDSTLNRGGVRFGTSELYGVVDALPEIADSLVIGLEESDGSYWMPLFVALRSGVALDDDLRTRIVTAIRRELSPRHVPDEIIEVPAIPRTLTGKKMEVPVKRLLQGHAVEAVSAAGTTVDPQALEAFATMGRSRAGTDIGADAV
ncbi:MAG: acetoacetate--CoA ligase [Candidatus Limnocylindrales bacterium]